MCDDNQLMAYFRAVLAVSSAEDILEKVLPAMSTLEGSKRVTGSLDFARKSKSLIQRWLAKKTGDIKKHGVSPLDSEICIECDTILLLNVESGRGASATTIVCA